MTLIHQIKEIVIVDLKNTNKLYIVLKKKTQQLYIKTKVKSNISKPNPTAYKNNYIPQPSGIYLMYTRLVHHLKINNVLYHTNRQRKKKSHIITPKNAQKGI